MGPIVVSKSRFISRLFFTAFWIVAISPFVIQESTGSMSIGPIGAVTLFTDVVFIVLGCWTLRSRTDIAIIVTFLIYSYVSSCIVNTNSFIAYLNGLRLYIGFLFIIPIIRYFFDDEERRRKFVAAFDKMVYVYLWLQVPTMVYQCIMYGAYDLVGGTLGWMMSGVTSILIYLLSFYLMLRRWDYTKSYGANLIANKVLLFLLLPSYLNETKISFIMLALYLLFLNPIDKKFLKRLIWIIPSIMIALSGALYLYYQLVESDSEITSEDYITVYLLGDEEALNGMELIVDMGIEPEKVFDNGDVSRGFKFFVVPALLNRAKHGYGKAVGYGLGQFKGGTFIKKSRFAIEYEWILSGTLMEAYVVLVELGGLGLALYFLYWFIMLRFGRQLGRERNKQLQCLIVLTILIFTVYNNSYIIPPFYIIFSFLLFVSSRWTELPPYRKTPLFFKSSATTTEENLSKDCSLEADAQRIEQ